MSPHDYVTACMSILKNEKGKYESKPGLESEGVGTTFQGFYMGRLRPAVQPPTLLCTALTEKLPLCPFYRKKVPLQNTNFRAQNPFSKPLE